MGKGSSTWTLVLNSQWLFEPHPISYCAFNLYCFLKLNDLLQIPDCVSVLLPLRVVSGSRDATLRVWDIETGQCLHVLMGHVAAVRCVQYDGRRVVSGAYDFMVKVWDPETETCLHTLQGHTNRVYSLQVSSFKHSNKHHEGWVIQT